MSDTYPTRTVTAPSYRPADAPKVVYVWCAKPSDDIELSVVPTYTPIDTNVISIAVTGSTGRDNGNTRYLAWYLSWLYLIARYYPMTYWPAMPPMGGR